jgi:hypothetical protein
VEGVVHDHDRLSLREVPRDLDGVHHRLCPRVDEHRPVLFVAGDQFVQPLGNRHVRLVQRHVETRVGETTQLLPSRLDHGRRAVARVEHGQPGAQVDQAVAVDVPDDPAEGGVDEDGYGAEDPAGDGLQAPFEQLLRSGPGNLGDEAPFLLDVHPPVASWGEDEPKRLAFPSLHAAREGIMATTVKGREMFIGGEWNGPRDPERTC